MLVTPAVPIGKSRPSPSEKLAFALRLGVKRCFPANDAVLSRYIKTPTEWQPGHA